MTYKERTEEEKALLRAHSIKPYEPGLLEEIEKMTESDFMKNPVTRTILTIFVAIVAFGALAIEIMNPGTLP